LSRFPVDGGLHATDLPGGSSVEWVVHQHGFQRVYGSRASFRPVPPPDEGFWADVALKPGFGIRLHALDMAGNALAQVEIAFDGQSFRTDGAGLAYLTSSNIRPTLDIDVGHWKIVGGDFQPDGTFISRRVRSPEFTQLRVTLD